MRRWLSVCRENHPSKSFPIDQGFTIWFWFGKRALRLNYCRYEHSDRYYFPWSVDIFQEGDLFRNYMRRLGSKQDVH